MKRMKNLWIEKRPPLLPPRRPLPLRRPPHLDKDNDKNRDKKNDKSLDQHKNKGSDQHKNKG